MLAGLGRRDDVLCSNTTLTNLVGHKINGRFIQWRSCGLKGSNCLEVWDFQVQMR